MAVGRRAYPARHFDPVAVHEAIESRADLEIFRLRALCRKIGITPELARLWSAENPDQPYGTLGLPA